MGALEAPITAVKLGQLLGISERRVCALKAAGILAAHSAGRGLDIAESVRGYCDHLRCQAAGRQAKELGRLDLKQETARLKVSQRKHVDLKNAVIERTHVPLAALEPSWARVVRAVRGAVLAIPGRARFALPHLSVHDSQVLEEVC